MYLLDTNVVSELRMIHSGKVDPRFRLWAEEAQPEKHSVSAATIMELEVGVLLMERLDRAQGAMLRRWIRDQVISAFGERILPVDLAVAQRCAALHVPNPRPEIGAMIAATALVHGMTVATRNVAEFAATGVAVFNPWQA
jgi:predicted nucleic acid-binding protein